MKTFRIVKLNPDGQEHICNIESNNGKNALRKFRKSFMSTGFSEIHKRKTTGTWELSTSYGCIYIAVEM